MGMMDGWEHPEQGWAVMCQLHALKRMDQWKRWPENYGAYGPNDESELAVTLTLEIAELATYLGTPGDDDMAKKQEKIQWVGFKDVTLTDTQRDAYEHWDVQDGDLYELVAVTVSQGYKFTCSYNQSNDTYTASFTGTERAPAAAKGYTLSAFAPTWYDAVRTLCFKHDLVLDGDWSNIQASGKARWG